MHWLLGLVGALIGVALADERSVLGAVAGFLIAFLLAGQQRLRRQVELLAADLARLRARQAAGQVAAGASANAGQVAAGASANAAAAAAAGPVPAEAAAPIDSTPRPAMPAVSATAPRTAAAQSEPPPIPPRPSAWRAPAPSGPSWADTLLARVKGWFTEGNVPVKIGVLVLLFGVAAALRYAAAQGYFTLPVEVRLALVWLAALLALGWGWRERLRRPTFAMSVQGGALGVLLLTVFAAFRLYGLLPATLALALVVVLVAGAALLAVLQGAMWLAVLGFLGGYLAPVLISTGSGSHVALFSYYALLNAAVLAISWKHSWRLLNLIGFGFTFGVGATWGASFYRPEMFASVEPFLVLFFAFYIAVGLIYVLRQAEHRRPWVDGTLVFGTPLVAFPLQAALLRDDRLGLAFSALAVAVVYAGLVWFLRARRGERLLTEAYGALALGFATLAIPLAFSASTTASVWALEGAGAAWIGLRQGRRFPWLAGLALQLLAAASYVLSFDHAAPALAPMLLFNPAWLGAAMLSFAGFALSLMHERHHARHGLPALAFWWGMSWWAVGGLGQVSLANAGIGGWTWCAAYLAITVALAALLRAPLRWSRLDGALAVGAIGALLLVPYAQSEFGQVLDRATLAGWAALAVALAFALWRTRAEPGRTLALAHLAALWTVAAAFGLQVIEATERGVADGAALADGWRFLARVAPLALMTLVLWRRPALGAWPRAQAFTGYRWGWFAPALLILASAWLAGLLSPGNSAPLAYIPLFNPLELALLGTGALLFGVARDLRPLQSLRQALPVAAFAFLSFATLRAVHHWAGVAWDASALLSDGTAQASLTVAWSLVGVSAWVLGSRRRDRRLWGAGALLMGIVLVKLLFVDRSYMGNMAGIVSFMAVGLLLVGVGYVAPSPPRRLQAGEPA
jgi:uncharacterized membrane protein